MTIPRWRLAIVAGALIVLSAVGVGLVQAAPAPSASSPSGASAGTPAADAAAADAPFLPAQAGSGQPAYAGERLRALRDRVGDRWLWRLRGHVVHGTVTVLDRDGQLLTLQLDHGTISTIADGSITIAEAGGARITVATNAGTRVRKDGKPASLSGLAVGDEVIVQSVLEGSSATARRILVPAPKPATAPAGSGSGS